MLLTILQVAVLIVLGFAVVTQVIRPALKGERIFPALRKEESQNVPGNGGTPGRDSNEQQNVQ